MLSSVLIIYNHKSFYRKMDPWEENWDEDDDEDYVGDFDEEDEDEDDAVDWWENDIPTNCRDFGDACVQSGSSSGAKKSNET